MPGRSRTSGILCVARVEAGPMPEGTNCGGRQEPAQMFEAKNVPAEVCTPMALVLDVSNMILWTKVDLRMVTFAPLEISYPTDTG